MPSSSSLSEQQYVHQYQPQSQGLQELVNNFWTKQYQEIEETTDFRSHRLPLSRIKKIMKKNKDVESVSAEATSIVGKACEYCSSRS